MVCALPFVPIKHTVVAAQQPSFYGGAGRAAGIEGLEEDTRGWDHGVFVPLALAFDAATLPVVELSVLSTLDPEVCAHLLPCRF